MKAPLKELEKLTERLHEPIVNSKILHELLKMCADAYWIWHIPSGYDYLSDGWQELLGYSADELPHHFTTWQNLLNEKDFDRAYQAVKKHLDSKGKIPYSIDFKMKKKDGSRLAVHATGGVVQWDDDEPIIMAGKLTSLEEERHGT